MKFIMMNNILIIGKKKLIKISIFQLHLNIYNIIK